MRCHQKKFIKIKISDDAYYENLFSYTINNVMAHFEMSVIASFNFEYFSRRRCINLEKKFGDILV